MPIRLILSILRIYLIMFKQNDMSDGDSEHDIMIEGRKIF